MVKIYDKDLRTVSTSRNLRGILEYTRKNTVERVDIWPNKSGAQFGITWSNGSSCISEFADATVCAQFFRHRIARFPVIKIHSAIPGITE